MPSLSRTLLGATFIGAGLLHFLKPRPYESIMPRALPAHRELVYASGVAELAGGAGVLFERTSPLAGWWLIATMLGVFPANVNMAIDAAVGPPPSPGSDRLLDLARGRARA
jgi:uncharacterized membrane protein